jgi:hypothetical protein
VDTKEEVIIEEDIKEYEATKVDIMVVMVKEDVSVETKHIVIFL